MRRHEISDDPWGRIRGFLPGQAADPGVTVKDNRLYFFAVLWIAKTGPPGVTSPGVSTAGARRVLGASLRGTARPPSGMEVPRLPRHSCALSCGREKSDCVP